MPNYSGWMALKVQDAQRLWHRIEGLPTPSADLPADTLLVRDAIALSANKNYLTRSDLSQSQKHLAELVAEERQTASGRFVTDEAARGGYKLRLHADPNVKIAGLNHDDTRVIDVGLRQSSLVAHHEFVHAAQNVAGLAQAPKGSSSFDQALWYMGREGQAHVAEEVQRRELMHLPALTPQEKSDIFARLSTGAAASNIPTDQFKAADNFWNTVDREQFYGGHYEIGQTTRTDGRKLDPTHFVASFGTVPGHADQGNFLKAHNYADAADAFKGTQVGRGADYTEITSFEQKRWEAEQSPLSYNELPKTKPGQLRFDSSDKGYVIYANHLKDPHHLHIELYRMKDLLKGRAYVHVDSRDQPFHLDPDAGAAYSINGTARAVDTQKLLPTQSRYINLDVDNHGRIFVVELKPMRGDKLAQGPIEEIKIEPHKEPVMPKAGNGRLRPGGQ